MKQDVIRPQQGCGEVPVVVTAEGCFASCLHRAEGFTTIECSVLTRSSGPCRPLAYKEKKKVLRLWHQDHNTKGRAPWRKRHHCARCRVQWAQAGNGPRCGTGWPLSW